MMTINEVRELKVGDTVVFNGGHSAIVMEIQAFGNGRIEYVLKDALEKAFHYSDVDISRCACGSYRGLSPKADKYKQMLNARYGGIGTTSLLPEIADVIFSGPATIVQWKDGTKTVVKCSEGENFDPEKGLVMAITKKALGNKGNYYETIKKWLENKEKTV